MKRLVLLAPVLVLVGCGSEPAPTVGDAEISKGITSRKAPQPPAHLQESQAAARARVFRPGQSVAK
ncbi:MAG: hypothetical protein ACO1SV_01725 [Fimbriimonas sp.]